MANDAGAPTDGGDRTRSPRPASTPSARAVTYSVVALLAAAAVYRTPPRSARPAARDVPPAEAPELAAAVDSAAFDPAAAPEAAEPAVAADAEWIEHVDTLRRGQSLVALLERRGVSRTALAAALRRRRVPAGAAITVRGRAGDSAAASVVVELAPDHLLRLTRSGERWESGEERLPWVTDTIVVSGTVRSTLAAAFADAESDLPRAQRTELAYTLADIFEYRVDMSRDLQRGDQVHALVERSTGPRGMSKLGKVLAARLDLSGNRLSAVRYSSRSASGEYFDESGKSLKAHFLRAPLAFRRISSSFGRRRHPILGIVRQHKGTDYAAAQGTPVRAVGDGVVIKAGRAGGYGNVLEIRLRNGYVTRYGHLRNFAKGMRPGTRVTVGQTVAYVGTTGLSSGPHLHFEMLVRGVNRDPRVALKELKGGEPVARGERASFAAARTRLLGSLERSTEGATVATAN